MGIRESGREGDVMYVGVPSWTSKEVIGMKLDEKRSKSDCDGKGPSGDRLFRCPAGYGIFLPSEDCELLPREDENAFNSVQAPETKLDVQAALAELVGLVSVKTSIGKVQQVVEVQKKREALGVHGGRLLHFTFRGNHGTGMSAIAQLLGHMLRDLEVLATGHTIESSRKELLGSGDAEKQMSKIWKAASGGVLVLNDAHQFIDRERSRDTDGLEATEFLSKQLTAMATKCSGDKAAPCFPQSCCIVLCVPQDAQLPEPLQRVQTHMVDFPDFSNEELVEVLVQLVQKRKFSLAKNLTADKLLPFIREASRCCTDAHSKNIIMLQRILDEAIGRQTERAWNAETVSLEGLTMLTEEDFVDSMSLSREESIKKVMAKLEAVVGLTNVKAF